MKIKGREIISIDPEAYVIDAIFFMKRNNIRRIVVSKGKDILGIFSVDEALYHIINNDVECKLKDAKLKNPIRVSDNELREVMGSMVRYDVDSVLYDDKIITYKDIVSKIDWNKTDRLIGEISKQAIFVEPYTKIKTAGEIMIKNKIRHLPVYEKSLYGIISARDLVYNYDIDLNLSVSKIMVVEVFYTSKEEPISKVVSTMITRNIGSVVVINSKTIEIVTLKDLVDFALRNLIY
ncbi:CBS domain-containing protein [Sulfurisphaera javensis]|uniref:CBS domain-containing protein n=1 Tax=Sulfurisphaera javensis TaxID=2049879 RepID=A0AAT9GNK2_9CREN